MQTEKQEASVTYRRMKSPSCYCNNHQFGFCTHSAVHSRALDPAHPITVYLVTWGLLIACTIFMYGLKWHFISQAYIYSLK